MIRYLLLGGRWGPVPGTFLLALGAACLGAAALFGVLYNRWSSDPLVGFVELAVLVLAGAVLLGVGLRRKGSDRASTPRRTSAGAPRPPPPGPLP